MEILVHQWNHDDDVSEECINNIVTMIQQWSSKRLPKCCRNDHDVSSEKDEDWCLDLGVAS